MTEKEKIKALLKRRIAQSMVSADNENYLIQLSIKEGRRILALLEAKEQTCKRGEYRTPEINGLMEELKDRLIKAGAEQGGDFILVAQAFLGEFTNEEQKDFIYQIGLDNYNMVADSMEYPSQEDIDWMNASMGPRQTKEQSCSAETISEYPESMPEYRNKLHDEPKSQKSCHQRMNNFVERIKGRKSKKHISLSQAIEAALFQSDWEKTKAELELALESIEITTKTNKEQHKYYEKNLKRVVEENRQQAERIKELEKACQKGLSIAEQFHEQTGIMTNTFIADTNEIEKVLQRIKPDEGQE